MNKDPILPNWQPPAQRRQRFSASRGIALVRALRMRLAEQTQECCVQTQLEFRLFVPAPGIGRHGVSNRHREGYAERNAPERTKSPLMAFAAANRHDAFTSYSA